MWHGPCGDGRLRPSRDGEAERPSNKLQRPNCRILAQTTPIIRYFPNNHSLSEAIKGESFFWNALGGKSLDLPSCSAHDPDRNFPFRHRLGSPATSGTAGHLPAE